MLASVKLLVKQFVNPRVIRSRIVERIDPRSPKRTWDRHFRDWMRQAEAKGLDVNDVGDEAWEDDHLEFALREFYLPFVLPGSAVLELGPGTGRVTRHLVGRCARLELADNSPLVIRWISKYLSGKCDFRAHLVEVPEFSRIRSGTIDTAIAHGVFEHLDFDEAAFYLQEFFRVLRPGGHASLNYDTLHNAAGVAWFEQFRNRPGDRCIFRFYTPDFMARLGELAGFEVELHYLPEDRLAHIVFRKPDATTQGVAPRSVKWAEMADAAAESGTRHWG